MKTIYLDLIEETKMMLSLSNEIDMMGKQSIVRDKRKNLEREYNFLKFNNKRKKLLIF